MFHAPGHVFYTSAKRASNIWRRTDIRRLTSDASDSRARIVFSGIQPTGIPHLGNFLGALQNWTKLQQEAHREDALLFAIVGWHSLTLPQNPQALRVARREMLAALLAVGLDPKRSIIFHQDENPHHTELAWILNCITPMGKLLRMTTWKARLAVAQNARHDSEVDESELNAGLFTYPVLQAADILAYRATHVPVGEDQKQHLELARDIAGIFNRTFKPLFPLPRYVATPTRRIASLKSPGTKMSKSSPDLASRILLTDTDAQIKSKIRGAITDSIQGITFDPLHRPGTSNLLTILAACTGAEGAEGVAEMAKRYEDKGHGELKADVTEAVMELMRQPRSEFERLRGEIGYLAEVARDGAVRARERSEVTMREVRQFVGLA